MTGLSVTGHVVAVAQSSRHDFSKTPVDRIQLLPGLGVADDAHAGVTVQHRSRVRTDPTQPNLRQVHLLQAELLDDLCADGFAVPPGALGENVTTRGIDLLALPPGARLQCGADAVVEVTGLRNPCGQIERYRPGLLAAVLDRAADGTLIRKAGIMAIVRIGGALALGNLIRVTMPAAPWRTLEPVLA